jgi:ATP-dependent RNA helicase DeaD
MKKEVDRICTLLVTRGYTAKGLHGDMEQNQREEVIQSFRDSKIDTLIATDVAARGIDVLDVTHVFNYHIPFDPESYIHRIGRTARAGRKGVAITLVTPLEFKDLKRIQRLIGTSIQKSKIPTGSEVRKAFVSNLLYEIQGQGIKEEAKEIMEALQEEMDLSLMAYKLISYLLDKQEVVGPDEIGISERQLKKILYFQHKNQLNKRKFSQNRKKRPFNKKRINN